MAPYGGCRAFAARGRENTQEHTNNCAGADRCEPRGALADTTKAASTLVHPKRLKL